MFSILFLFHYERSMVLLDKDKLEALREDLIQDFGMAMVNASSVATVFLSEAENGDEEKLEELAEYLYGPKWDKSKYE